MRLCVSHSSHMVLGHVAASLDCRAMFLIYVIGCVFSRTIFLIMS